MSKKKQWLIQGDNYEYAELPDIINKLEPAVYQLETKETFAGPVFYLKKVAKEFTFPEKIYDLEDALIKRTIKTYKSLDKNFGVLFKGLKGTGKTVTAKLICKELNIPVILINKAYNDMGVFVNSIKQDIILMFDEFEKVYNLNYYADESASTSPIIGLLGMMDGVLNSTHKRLFLLTTNEVNLPDTLESRPSRIRYIKEFSNLSYSSIMEIFDDCLENKELTECLIKVLEKSKFVTVDIVKSLVQEANIHDSDDPTFYSIFNIKREQDNFSLYQLINEGTNKEEFKLIERFYEYDPENYILGSSFIGRNHNGVGIVIHIDKDTKVFSIKSYQADDQTIHKYLIKEQVYSNQVFSTSQDMVL